MPGLVPGIHVFPSAAAKGWPGQARPSRWVWFNANGLLRRPGEQQQIAVRVLDDEIARAPGLVLECLMERDAGRLELEKQLLDLGGGRDRDGGREQALAIAPLAIDRRPIDAAQV